MNPEPIRTFSAFTHDLEALAAWLKTCEIRSVAMQSTGVYWIPLFQVLERHGFGVCLVDARHLKNVTGRKTDGSDGQWLEYLHAVGLLKASFRPRKRSARCGPSCAIGTPWWFREPPRSSTCGRRSAR